MALWRLLGLEFWLAVPSACEGVASISMALGPSAEAVFAINCPKSVAESAEVNVSSGCSTGGAGIRRAVLQDKQLYVTVYPCTLEANAESDFATLTRTAMLTIHSYRARRTRSQHRIALFAQRSFDRRIPAENE